MALNGVDVSSNQPANVLKLITYDFAIVKATGNPNAGSLKWNYKNPYMRQQVDDALNATGCAGLYHFAFGVDATKEADLFVDTVADYAGRVILVLDYEKPLSDKNNIEWCRTFINRVKERTGVTCVLYASSSVISSQNLASLGIPIWSANYWAGDKAINGYNIDGLKMNYAASTIWQYTSNGYLSGFNGPLDLNIFYGDKDAWLALASGNGAIAPAEPAPSRPSGYDGDIAALQKACNDQGFSNQAVDGIAGPNTLAGCPMVKQGARGEITRFIQKRLIRLGYKLPKYGADGTFGAETTATVKAFQQANGLSVDGIVGPNTWRALLGL